MEDKIAHDVRGAWKLHELATVFAPKYTHTRIDSEFGHVEPNLALHLVWLIF